MDEMRKLEAKGLARARSRARRRRVATIRRRTIGGSLALFAVLWTIVFAQLASGDDPGLSGNSGADSRSSTPARVEPAREPAPEAEAGFEPGVELEEEPQFEEFEPELEAEAPIVTSSS